MTERLAAAPGRRTTQSRDIAGSALAPTQWHAKLRRGTPTPGKYLNPLAGRPRLRSREI
jgi:hypothetical protein